MYIKKQLSIGLVALLFMAALAVVLPIAISSSSSFAYPILTLSDAELATQFAWEWGPGTLTGVSDIAGPGVQFNFTGLSSSSGTGVGDNFPISDLVGGAPKTVDGWSHRADFSHFSQYTLGFTNVGTEDIMVCVKINTGWTVPPPSFAAGWRDTYWQSPWSDWFGPGESKNVTLDFSNATVYNAGDETEFTAHPDGTTGVAVWRLDEVSQIGFQVLGGGGGGGRIVVSAYPILTLSDAELSTQFTKQWGPGTLTGVTDIPGLGVRFDFTGLSSSGTGVGDNHPVSKLAGGGYKTYGVTNPTSFFGDFSKFSQYSLNFTNVGSTNVTVCVYINTGWTGIPPEYGAGWRDTYWQSAWAFVGLGESQIVTLNFSSSAEAWNIADDVEYPGHTNGESGTAVWRLDEVSHIGFQVLGQSPGSIIVSAYTPSEEYVCEIEWEQRDTYIVTGGQMDAKVQLQMGPLPLPPLGVPFVSRDPWLTPMTMWQDINFSAPCDPDGPGPLPTCIVFLAVPWQSIKSLEHVFFSGTLGYTRIKLLPIPGSNGMGWLYIVPGIADVDIHVFNTYMNNTMPPPYNVTNPPEIPIAMWTGPSPMAGAPAAIPTQMFYPFPDPGPDTLPGFCPLGPGTQDDGFGDGVPDPAGSSVLFLPLQMSVESWNGTAWVFTFGGPFVLPMTTGTAFDAVVAPGRALDGEVKMFTGAPWENCSSTGGMWGANGNKKFVIYAYAWSFIQYYLSDGPPVVKLDLIYGGTEKKVKDVHVVNDISCDNIVNIQDIVIAALAFGAADEGSPAAPGYDPTGEGEWPGPYPPYMPPPWYVDAQPNLEGKNFDARADLDNNGIIDIVDLVAIAIDFGETV